MTSSTCITLENNFPSGMGILTVAITDGLMQTVELAVPGNGSVQHPTDPANAPWTVVATLTGAEPLTPSVTGSELQFTDPGTVVTMGLDTTLTPLPSSAIAPAPVPVPDPAASQAQPQAQDASLSGGRAASAVPGFAAPDTSSLFDPVHQTPVSPVEVPVNLQLNLAMAQQTQSNWCWAAVGSSVKGYFSGAAGPSQCSLATWAFGPAAACCSGANAGGATCNQPYFLDRVLTYVGCLNAMRSQAMIFGDVVAEIAAGRPVGVRVQFAGGHFLCIDGYDASSAGNPTIDLKDPYYGAVIVQFSGFPANYHGATAWTHSYLTKA